MADSENTNIEEIIATQQLMDNEAMNIEPEQLLITSSEAIGLSEPYEAKVKDFSLPEGKSEVPAGAASDETFDNQCQPCLSEDINVESVKYCVSCKEYLCETCVQHHKKVSITKKHQLLNKTEIKADKQKVIKPLETCSQHVGKELELFCEDHDKLCCTSCKVTDHRECENVVLITEAASEVRDSDEFKTVNQELKQTRSELKDLVSKRANDGTRIVKERDTAIEVLTKYAEDIVEKVSKLKAFDENKINTKLEDESKVIGEDVNNCKEVDSMLSNASAILEKDTFDDIYTFTQMKRVQQNIISAKQIMSAVSNKVGSEKIAYAEDKLVSANLDCFKRLGVLQLEKRVYKNVTSKKISILSKSETKSEINAMCILNDEWLLMTDWENSNLKLLIISKMNIVESIKFDASPFGVCDVTDGEIAVTILHEHTVQFVSFDKDKTPHLRKEKKTFDTGEKCRGIAYLNSELFIACGGCGTDNEGPGHIRVYSLDGALNKTIMADQTGVLITEQPYALTVSPNSNILYLVDLAIGLLKLNSTDAAFSKLIVKSNSYGGGIVFDEHESIFMMDYENNAIDQIGTDDKFVGTVLTENDGINQPQAVAYDSRTRQLYVAMEEATEMCVFHLDYD